MKLNINNIEYTIDIIKTRAKILLEFEEMYAIILFCPPKRPCRRRIRRTHEPDVKPMPGVQERVDRHPLVLSAVQYHHRGAFPPGEQSFCAAFARTNGILIDLHPLRRAL